MSLPEKQYLVDIVPIDNHKIQFLWVNHSQVQALCHQAHTLKVEYPSFSNLWMNSVPQKLITKFNGHLFIQELDQQYSIILVNDSILNEVKLWCQGENILLNIVI